MTVKEFIEQEKLVRGSYAELELDNPHLSNLQNNEIVFVEGVPHIKTSIVFGGSQAPDNVAKIEDLEIKNGRLELELSHLQVKYEAAQMRSEALQNYIKNSNVETYRQNMKNQKEASILQEKISNLEDMVTNLTQKNQAKDNQISNLEAKIIKTTQKNQTKDPMVSNSENTIAKLIQKNQVKDAIINDLTIKNKKMRVKVQLLSELSQLVYKLNKKCQNAEAELIADLEEYKDI